MKKMQIALAVGAAILLIGCSGGGGSTPTDSTANSGSATDTNTSGSADNSSNSGSESGTGFGSFTAVSAADLKGVTIVFKTDPNLNADGVFTTTHAIACDGTFHTTTTEALSNGPSFTLHDYTGTPDVEVSPEYDIGHISFADASSDSDAMTYITILTDGTGTFYEGQCYLGSYDSDQCLWGQIAYSVTRESCN